MIGYFANILGLGNETNIADQFHHQVRISSCPPERIRAMHNGQKVTIIQNRLESFQEEVVIEDWTGRIREKVRLQDLESWRNK